MGDLSVLVRSGSFEVTTKWEDGSVSRPMIVAIQDLRSGVILVHRIGRDITALARDAWAELVRIYGTPTASTMHVDLIDALGGNYADAVRTVTQPGQGSEGRG